MSRTQTPPPHNTPTPTNNNNHTPLPTVAEVLTLPELTTGDPELVAGHHGLERHVRWAHVVAGVSAPALLDGGELILTTGAGWPNNNTELDTLAHNLAQAGPAAIILEIGANFDTAPQQLITACNTHNIPLIEVRHEIRFVQITQRIHQRVLAAQNEALQAQTEVHAMLTELGLNRSPVDYVIEQLSRTLMAPVVLEDSAARVIAWATPGSENPEQILSHWANEKPNKIPPPPNPGWARVPVEARGTRWGYLTALPGAPHPAGRHTVLELGAFALALGRLAEGDGDQWLEFSSKQLFRTLLAGRYRRNSELDTQLAASGLPITGRTLVGATLEGNGEFGSHHTLQRAILETALRRAVAPEGRAIIATDTNNTNTLLALLSFPEGDTRLQASPTPHTLASRLDRELSMLLPDTTPHNWRAHLSLGASGQRVGSLIASLEQVRRAGRLPGIPTGSRVTVQQAEQQPLAYLVRGLKATPAVQEFSKDTLGPLIEYDKESGPGRSGDLLKVLEAYLAHPANKSLAAQRARLSRSVFYQRLSLIEHLLAVDLSDGITIASLTVALLARPQ